VLRRLPGVKAEDGIATAGLFGAVSASTLAAAMALLEEQEVGYEAWVPALYPFMDIPALIVAIVLANVYLAKKKGGERERARLAHHQGQPAADRRCRPSCWGSAGSVDEPRAGVGEFYDPLFRGFLSILMLTMGMEAWSRIASCAGSRTGTSSMPRFAPLIHGLIAFGLGYDRPFT
jgi:hypothetical protein